MSYKKTYEIYQRSRDGLLKEPSFDEGYACTSSFYKYDTEEAAIKAIVEKKAVWEDFIILPVIQYVEQ